MQCVARVLAARAHVEIAEFLNLRRPCLEPGRDECKSARRRATQLAAVIVDVEARITLGRCTAAHREPSHTPCSCARRG